MLQKRTRVSRRKSKGKPKGSRKGAARPKTHAELVVAQVDADMVRRYLNLNYLKPISELEKLEKDKTLAFGEAATIRVMMNIYRTGDVYAFNAYLDRLIGPVLRKIQVTGERPFESWTFEDLMREKERLDKENRFTTDMIEKERKLVAAVKAGNYDREKGEIIEIEVIPASGDKTGSD